jgi:hypothetical protein
MWTNYSIGEKAKAKESISGEREKIRANVHIIFIEFGI